MGIMSGSAYGTSTLGFSPFSDPPSLGSPSAPLRPTTLPHLSVPCLALPSVPDCGPRLFSLNLEGWERRLVRQGLSNRGGFVLYLVKERQVIAVGEGCGEREKGVFLGRECFLHQEDGRTLGFVVLFSEELTGVLSQFYPVTGAQ